MNIEDILNDIVSRLPEEVFARYGEPGILRAINRLYHNLNRETECLEKNHTLAGDHPFALPDDVIKIFDIRDQNDDQIVFVNPEVFDSEEDDYWTIRNRCIEISSYDETSETFTIQYFSSGFELVITVADPLTEVNEPEWPEKSLHSILFYGVVTELSQKHDSYKQDRLEYYRLKNELMRLNWDKQSATPSRIVPHQAPPANKYVDEYERPYKRDL